MTAPEQPPYKRGIIEFDLAVDAAARIRAGVAPFGVPNDGALGMAQAVADGPGSHRCAAAAEGRGRAGVTAGFSGQA